MASEWATSYLRDEADLLTGFPFKSAGYTDAIDGVRLLRGDNIVQAGLRWDGVKRWPRETAHAFLTYDLAVGDVVLAMDRPWIEAGLKFAAISRADLPCLLVQRTSRIRGGDRLDIGFLRYLIGSRQFTQHVLAVQTGTTIPHISGRQILDFEFLLPPLPEQKRIAHILGTLDDKIDLNRRMNATLEAMSRAIFKSWFVDFDPVRQKAAGKQPVGMDAQTAALFPDSFEDSEIGEVPKGWRVGSVSDYADLNSESWSKATYPEEVRYVDLSSTKWGEVEAVEIHGRESAPSRAQRILREGDTIFGTVRPGNGSFAFVEEDGLTGSTGFAVLRPKHCESREYVYLATTESENVDRLAHLADGGAYPAVRPEVVADTSVVIAPPEVVQRFSVCTSACFERIGENRSESRTLATLRDTLLPKLLSGEVRVREAEGMVEEAIG